MDPDINRIDETQIQGKHAVIKREIETTNYGLEESTIRRLFKEFTSLKSLISNLQNDVSIQATQSSGLNTRMNGVLSLVSHLESGSGSLTSIRDLQSMKTSLTEKICGLQRQIIDAETVMQNAISDNLKELKILYSNLDIQTRSEYSQMSSKVSTLAKCSDLKAIEEYLEGGIHDHDARIGALQRAMLHTEESLLEMKHHILLSTVLRVQSNSQRRLLKRSIFIWCRYVTWRESEIAASNARRKTICKIISTCWFRKKLLAFEKWRECANWQRRIEIKQKEIMICILRRIENQTHAVIRFGFHKWRRAVIADRIDFNPKASNSAQASYFSSEQYDMKESYSKRFDLTVLLDTFKNDRDGAIQILANEVSNIKSVDFGTIRQEMHSIRERILASCEDSLMSQICKIQETFCQHDEKLTKMIKSSTSEIPGLKADTIDLRNALNESVSRIHSIEDTHHDRLEVLFEAKEKAHDATIKLKKELSSAQLKIVKLESNESEMRCLLNELSSRISTLEACWEGHHSNVETELVEIKEHVRTISSRFHSCESNQSSMSHDLMDLRNDVIQSKIYSNEKFNEIDKTFSSYGVSEPKHDDIIKYGILHENISKEKNYVIPLNCIYDISDINLDVPSCIASFAHDYAAWIAYHSDHDSLKLTVVGKSADEAVDTEDETEERRLTLVNSFKKMLLSGLEKVNPDAGSARLEARSFYVSRVIDAVETALSKHNQVSIPASTRLGRVRSTVSTCVACDRPLSRKTARRHTTNEKTDDKEMKSISSRPKTLLVGDDAQKYILRGGFKFPVKNNS